MREWSLDRAVCRSRGQARRWRLPRWREMRGDSCAERGSWRLYPAHALAGGGVDRGTDALIAAATANVGDGGIDVGVGRAGIVLEQRGYRHDHSALAIAALRNVEFDPRPLHGMQGIVGPETFDGGDVLVPDRANRQCAGAHRLAVDMHRAGAALRD